MSGRRPSKPVAASELEAIDGFLDAGRDIRRCAIAQRIDLSTLGTRMHLAIGPGGLARLEWERTSRSEIVEAAVALRPLMLQSEWIYAPKVLNFIGRRVTDAAIRSSLVGPMRKRWTAFDHTHYWAFGVSVPGKQHESGLQTDRQIAEDYIYGKLVHRDPERLKRLEYLDESTMEQAAVLWAKDGILLAEQTCRLVQKLIDDGHLGRAS